MYLGTTLDYRRAVAYACRASLLRSLTVICIISFSSTISGLKELLSIKQLSCNKQTNGCNDAGDLYSGVRHVVHEAIN
jgi:hypothetical protein